MVSPPTERRRPRRFVKDRAVAVFAGRHVSQAHRPGGGARVQGAFGGDRQDRLRLPFGVVGAEFPVWPGASKECSHEIQKRCCHRYLPQSAQFARRLCKPRRKSRSAAAARFVFTDRRPASA